ncbi:MAG: RodZ domain-containing protein [Candidatus Latescibacterota bacterium]|nr:RodZ domain-containing protein [Candidatus Latescibacterota bacterium]
MSAEETSVAEELRRYRESRSETLDQVHQRTGIGLNVLRGLESGGDNTLEPVYVRMALIHYAKHLGLDADSLVDRYNQESEAPQERRVPVHEPSSGSPPLSPISSPFTKFLRRQPLAWLVGGTAAVSAFILFVNLYTATDTTPARQSTPTPQPAPEPAVEAPSTVSAVKPKWPALEPPMTVVGLATAPSAEKHAIPSATVNESTTTLDVVPDGSDVSVREGPLTEPPVQEPSASRDAGTERKVQAAVADSIQDPVEFAAQSADAAPGLPLVLVAKAIDSTWVQVQWDGVGDLQEIIPQGETRRWGARRFFMVTAGRAHGVHFSFRGQLLGEGRLGDRTKVLRFRATAEAVQLLGPTLEPIGIVASPSPDPAETREQHQ